MTNGDLVKEGQIDPSCTSSDILISNDQKERLGLKNRKFFFINFLTFLYLKKANYQLVCYISRNNLMISHENQGGQFDPPPLYRIGLKSICRSKHDYCIKVRSIESYSVSEFCWSRGTDDQERMKIPIHRSVKPFSSDYLTHNWFIGSKSNQLHHFQLRTHFSSRRTDHQM